MAERRMFSKTIIDCDLFLDMPVTSQLLYFHLAMRADDDGFVDKPKSIMRIIGCKDDDIKILIANQFIIPFESGIVVIRHWKIHNYIQKDRYHETTHKHEKALISEQDNVYTMDTECIHDVREMDTQARLGKDRLELGKSKKKAKIQPAPEKKNYADDVSLTDDEYNNLLSEYSKPFVDRCIEVLNNYKLSSGKKYKSDYYAILNWVIKRVKEESPQLAAQTIEPPNNEDLFKNPWTDENG